jgi:hypothetical protein
MSQRQEKKIRKLFRKRYGDEFFKQIVQGQFFKQFLKPKPKWCPEFLWIFFLKMVVNVNFQNGNKADKNRGNQTPAKQP